MRRRRAGADRLELEAAEDAKQANSANETANEYMLAVVLFASSLFFAGISVKVEGLPARAVLLGLGSVVFVVWLSTRPVK